VAPKGQSTRPTADRVRQAVFDVLEHAAWSPKLPGARVADVFAGSGAYGLEALSRGAAFAHFVERGEEAALAIHANLAALGLERAARLDRSDAVRFTGWDGAYTLAFLDPPYGSGFAQLVLPRLVGQMTADGVIVVEQAAGSPPPVGRLLAHRKWGRAEVAFLATV